MTVTELNEKIKGLLERSTGSKWDFQPGWGIQYWKDGGVGLLVADGGEGAATVADLDLMAAAQDLARAFIELAERCQRAEEELQTLREWEYRRNTDSEYLRQAIDEAGYNGVDADEDGISYTPYYGWPPERVIEDMARRIAEFEDSELQEAAEAYRAAEARVEELKKSVADLSGGARARALLQMGEASRIAAEASRNLARAALAAE